MAVWSYSPQNVMTETLVTDTHVTQVSPATGIAGQHTANFIRGWSLQFAAVESTQATSMAAFFVTQNGPWLAFDFFNPNDNVTYRARFDSAMELAMFQPGLMQSQQINLVSVVGS